MGAQRSATGAVWGEQKKGAAARALQACTSWRAPHSRERRLPPLSLWQWFALDRACSEAAEGAGGGVRDGCGEEACVEEGCVTGGEEGCVMGVGRRDV